MSVVDDTEGKRDCDGHIMPGRRLTAPGVAFCVDRLMTVSEARALLCSKRGGVKRTEVYSTIAAVGYLEETDMEYEDDWDFADIPVKSRTDVRASLCLDFGAIGLRYWEAGLAVPEEGNDVLGLSLQGVSVIAERGNMMAEKRTAVAAKDSAVKEKEAACAEIVKLQEVVISSAQKIEALETQNGELTTDMDTTRREFTVIYVAVQGTDEVNAELVHGRAPKHRDGRKISGVKGEDCVAESTSC